MAKVKKKKRKWFIADAIIWDNFERFRAEKGWPYAEVARAMEVSPQHLAQIKAGALGVGPETLSKMTKAFGKNEEAFLEIHGTPGRLLVPQEIVDIYPRARFIVDMLCEVVKVNPTAEHLLEYGIDLLKMELSRERMRIEEARRNREASHSKERTKKQTLPDRPH